MPSAPDLWAQRFNLQYSGPSELTNTADKLRWYRYHKGLLQREVADQIGVDRTTYIHYEEKITTTIRLNI